MSAWAFGLPFPLVLAVITGLLDLIPQVGATIAAVILVARRADRRAPRPAIAMLVIQLIYQQVENYVVYPIVYRQAVELSGFTTIVAVLIAGSLLGVVGAILAVPFAAVIKIVLREAGAPRRARMDALRPRSGASKFPSDGDHSGPLIAPRRAQRARRRRCPSRRSAASVSAPGSAGRPGDRPAGVRLKRGAGAGWTHAVDLDERAARDVVRVLRRLVERRARRVAQASAGSSSAAHSSRVRVREHARRSAP